MPQQFQYVKLPDGSYGKFNADTPDTVIRSLILRQFPNAFNSTAQGPSYDLTKGLSNVTGLSAQPSRGPIADKIEALRQRLEQKVTTGSQSGAGEFMASPLLGALRMLRGVAQGGPATPAGTKDLVAGGLQSATIPSLVMAPETVDAIPSAARAGERFENVMRAAKDVPIPTEKTSAIAQRGQELASRGGQ